MQSTRLTTVATDVSDLIGETPMVWLKHDIPGVRGRIALKLEGENPLGSVKDRLALGIVRMAERDGLLTPGVSTLIEATSGNTGIGLALMGALRGYRVIIIMPESVSMERRAVLRAFGVDVRLIPKDQTMVLGIQYAAHIAKTIPNAFLCSQFETKYNAQIHFETTGPEMWSQTGGAMDYFVAGMGTGGTMAGVAQFLKSIGSACKTVAVEPLESQVLKGAPPGMHGIQGVGASFLTKIAASNMSLISEILPVHTDEAVSMARRLPAMSGVFCGISGGAAVAAAIQVASRPEAAGKVVVALIPSYGERYLSTALFDTVRKECDNLPFLPTDFASSKL